MGHVAIAVVYRVARARVRIGGWTTTALDNVISFALPFPFARSPPPFAFPVLVAVSVAELSVVLALGCTVIADARSHPLMVMNLIGGPPRAGGRTRV
jgi:hypothetical protein